MIVICTLTKTKNIYIYYIYNSTQFIKFINLNLNGKFSSLYYYYILNIHINHLVVMYIRK